MAAYIALAVQGLFLVGLWKQNLLKGTILWFAFSGLALMFLEARADHNQSIWRLAVVDQLKVIVLVQYLVNTYAFAFPIELLLAPVLTAVVLLDEIAKRDAKYSGVATLTTWLQTLFGFGILALATHQAVSHSERFQTLDTLRAVILPPVLSAVLAPLIYLLSLFLAYEQLLLRLKLGPPKDQKVVWYARRRLFCRLGLRAKRVRAFSQTHAWDLVRIRTRTDVDQLLDQQSSSAGSA